MIVPHELIQALIVTASDAIIAADRTGVINFWNLGTDRIFGFRAHETIGRSLDLIIPHNLRAPHWAGFNRDGDGSKSIRSRRPPVSASDDQKRPTHLRRVHDRCTLKDKQDHPTGTVAIQEIRKLKRELAEPTGSRQYSAVATINPGGLLAEIPDSSRMAGLDKDELFTQRIAIPSIARTVTPAHATPRCLRHVVEAGTTTPSESQSTRGSCHPD